MQNACALGVLTEKCRCAVMHCRDRKMSCMQACGGLNP